MRHDFEWLEGCSLLTFKIENQHLVTKLNVLFQSSDLEIDWKKSWIYILKNLTFCVHRVNKKTFNTIWCGGFRRGLFEVGAWYCPLLKYENSTSCRPYILKFIAITYFLVTIQNCCPFLSYLLKTDSRKIFLICSEFPPCLVTKLLLWGFKFLWVGRWTILFQKTPVFRYPIFWGFSIDFHTSPTLMFILLYFQKWWAWKMNILSTTCSC